MEFVVSDDELKDYLINHYDSGEEYVEKFDEFRDRFQQQLDAMDHEFYEIFSYCVREAIDGL